MFHFTDLKEQLSTYLSPEQVALITQAFLIADKAHHGQYRVTGEPYITHPIEVARILSSMFMDHESIMAAILHDVLEDCEITKEEIARDFGEKIAELVDGVSKLTQIQFESRREAQAENFRKMMLAMARDLRVIIIKLADRLHNMRTLGALAPEKRRRIALETLDIYAPIATRLGMNHMRIEFEDLGFAALYPLRYQVLKSAVIKSRGNRKEVLEKVEVQIQEALKNAGYVKFSVWGREKHLYSLYRKMRQKGLSFNEVLDVYAFRVIVQSVDDCYRALGIIHGLFKPVMGRFKDYIAIPKTNGYKSIHTTVIGPFGIPVEIQLRTAMMDKIAEEGIAAHWLYKSPDANDDTQIRTREWLQNLLDIQKNTGNALEFIDNVKRDLYSDAVYVFTPKGNILALPDGSTPIDFAYAVHTEVGNTCVACKVDRRLAPLSTRLVNGQTIEIITSVTAHPNPAWLSYAVSSKARTNIRHWLKRQQRKESRDLGGRLIDKELGRFGTSLEELDETKVNATLLALGVKSVKKLCEEVGLGKRMAALVAQSLMGNTDYSEEDELEGEEDLRDDFTPHSKPFPKSSLDNPALVKSTPTESNTFLGRLTSTLQNPFKSSTLTKKKNTSLSIRGTEGMVLNYATCCYPIPGDEIIGVMVKGKGITVHTESCSKIKIKSKNKSQNDNLVYLKWEDSVEGEYQVELTVDVVNSRGALATMAQTLSESGANIANVRIDERDNRHNSVNFIVEVRGRAHLARVMKRMRQLPMVTRIQRTKV